MGPKHVKKKVQVKKKQMVLAPRIIDESLLSDATTIPVDNSFNDRWREVLQDEDIHHHEELYDTEGTMDFTIEEPGLLVDDLNSESDLDDVNHPVKETDRMRDDMEIVTDRWDPDEVDALMTAININREAIKFHFDGPGGGRDVKRQGWRDVAAYVNDVAHTHRTVKQCRNKVSDYTQRCKAKFNRLRYAVATTGKGKIKKKLKIKKTEGKALDYLKAEAIKGIPGIEPMAIPCMQFKPPSRKNKALLWDEERVGKPDYNSVPMKREGVPNNYGQKNRRRVDREAKMQRRKDHEIKMKEERKREKEEAKEEKKRRKLDKIRERRARKEAKIKARAKKAKKGRKEKEREKYVVDSGQKEEKKKRRQKKKKDKEVDKKKVKKHKKERARGKNERGCVIMTIPGIQPVSLSNST